MLAVIIMVFIFQKLARVLKGLRDAPLRTGNLQNSVVSYVIYKFSFHQRISHQLEFTQNPSFRLNGKIKKSLQYLNVRFAA